MPRKRQRPHAGIRVLTSDLQQDLEEGPGGGLLDYEADYRRPDLLGLRAAWVMHGEAVLADWTDWGAHPVNVGTRPWGWWAFSAPEKWPPSRLRYSPHEGESETATLRRLGLLGADEEALLTADHDRASRDPYAECGCATCAKSPDGA